MNEVQRQAYLNAMGIQLYFPRIRLAGAKASPQYQLATAPKLAALEYAVTDAVSEPATSVASSSGSAQQASQPLHNISNDSGTEAGNEEDNNNQGKEFNDKSVDADSREGEAETEPPAELKFELCYYPISNKLAVIDEIPHHLGGESQVHSITLLRAILLALGLDSSHCEFLPQTFSWPLAAQLDMKNEPTLAARKALLGFIKKRHELDQFENLLIFAGQVDELLTVREDGQELRDFQFSDSDISSNYRLTITTSLQSMLAYPLLKRDVWKQLQPLRQRLAC